jgi:hypothetical protein
LFPVGGKRSLAGCAAIRLEWRFLGRLPGSALASARAPGQPVDLPGSLERGIGERSAGGNGSIIMAAGPVVHAVTAACAASALESPKLAEQLRIVQD